MIVAELDELAKQLALTPALQKALDFLGAHRKGEGLAERVEIDGAAVYALVQEFETVPAAAEIDFEAHRLYLDIQYVVSGEELMGWAPLSELTGAGAYNPAKDVLHGMFPAAAMTPVRVKAGQAAVFFPQDAHAPKLAGDRPGWVKKIVVKVAVQS